MTFTLKKTVAMVGMMGAGKTAVGKAVSQILGVPFLDSDSEIEQAANMTIPEIFERDGEPFFRAKETQVITRLLDGQPCILSTGGGAFLADVNRAAINEKGVAVWLDADLDLLWSRVKNKNTRPLLRTDNPYSTLKALYDQRTPIYELAQVHVQSSPNTAIDDMANRVISALMTRNDVLESQEP